jgi:hypothetical protein
LTLGVVKPDEIAIEGLDIGLWLRSHRNDAKRNAADHAD